MVSRKNNNIILITIFAAFIFLIVIIFTAIIFVRQYESSRQRSVDSSSKVAGNFGLNYARKQCISNNISSNVCSNLGVISEYSASSHGSQDIYDVNITQTGRDDIYASMQVVDESGKYYVREYTQN